jgi:hypothetical protein
MPLLIFPQHNSCTSLPLPPSKGRLSSLHKQKPRTTLWPRCTFQRCN